MKKRLSKVAAILVLVSVVMGIFSSCQKEKIRTETLLDFIPNDVSVVYKISNWESLKADISNNSLLNQFSKTNSYSFFSEESLLKNLKPTSTSILCINKTENDEDVYTFISKNTANLFSADSLKNKSIETLTYNKKSLQRIVIDEKTAFSAVIDSFIIFSSSQKNIEKILDGKTTKNKSFKKIFNLPTTGEFSVLFRGDKVKVTDSTQINLASWLSLDTTIGAESISATGIATTTDTIPQLLSVFKGQVPQQNDLAQAIPNNADEAVVFTFNDAELFQKNLKTFRKQKDDNPTSGIFGSVSEVGSFKANSANGFVLKSIDALLTQDALARYLTSQQSFREVEIHSFSEPELFTKTFFPIVKAGNAQFTFQIDNFFFFTESISQAEAIISDVKNSTTLVNSAAYKSSSELLNTSSSLMFFKMKGNFSNDIATFLNTDSEDVKNISIEKYPLAALQFTYDRNFAHVNVVCRESNFSPSEEGTVSESSNINLENPILGNPQLFTNTRTRGLDIVVQDFSNNLLLLSESGKTLWERKLETSILGAVEEVDIQKNGNKQLAFVTKNNFYVIDRNGKDVSPFPIKLNNEITQPLSVFDYDNNRNYRFVVTQGKEILMYDGKGKIVKGFGFTKAKSDLAMAPQHFRMRSKDYIVVANDNKTLNILSRVGKQRIPVSEKFDFSDISIQEEDNDFVVITKDNKKVRISENGKISTQNLDVSGRYWFTVKGNTKVTMDDNKLRIDGKLVNLPLGLYSRPKIFKFGRQTFITVTDTQENSVFVYDDKGNSVNGFPVYGSSTANIGKDAKGNIKILCKGADNEILQYAIK